MKSYLKEINKVYETILDYLEKEQNNDIQFADQKIINDKYELIIILRLISKIANNHNRSNNLFQKIENIIKSIKNEVLNYFSNHEIFEIFKGNKKMLLFLFQERIIIPDNYIFSYITNYKYSMKNYPSFFYPEFKTFFTNELIMQNSIDKINFEEFEEKRKIGENDNYISYLIRNDSIDEFIIYVNKTNFKLSNIIESSIYETNNYLIDKTPSLIEYSSFYGSIQIFQYLRLNGVELNTSLWNYAIHGRNADMIHLLEESNVSPSSYYECLFETIKCHHNELKNYIETNYIYEFDEFESDILIKKIKYCNYIDLVETFKGNSVVFYYLCKYEYVHFVKHLLESKMDEIYINYIHEKKKKIFYNDNGLREKKINEKKTPLIVAIEKGNQQMVEILVKQPNININSKYESNYSRGKLIKTGLFIAVEKGYSQIVQLLLNHENINVNEENIENEENKKTSTALHIAIEKEDIEMIKMLLNAKNINTNSIEHHELFVERYEKTPLIIAIEKENTQIIQLLLSKKETNPNIMYHFYVYDMVEDGYSHDQTIEKLTPLQLAVKNENKKVIQILLSNKTININEVGLQFIMGGRNGDEFHKTALHIAIEKNNFDIVQMLLSSKEIDVNAVTTYKYEIELNSDGYYEKRIVEKSPLSIAVESNNSEIIRFLLKQKNININIDLTSTSYVYNLSFMIIKQTIEKKKALDIANSKK